MEDNGHSINASIAPATPGFPPGGARSLGILMLQTRFPRPLGDLGNPASWGVPTQLLVVEGVGPQDAVTTAAALRASELLPLFEAGIRRLEMRGVAAITTSCGFLVLLQDQLASASAVPLVSSSLLQLPALLAQEQAVGVLTISADRLGDEHLLRAGVPAARLRDVFIEGMPADGAFSRAIMGNSETMDFESVAQEVVQAATRLQARAPTLATLVLECTNLPPYAQAIRAATGWRVLSLADSPALKQVLTADSLAA
ncbi:aspartate/glutamate racemase family protein [Caenimonas koreensis]|uniref:aspartate/glutamate racemase family protein n=1 Tax=Caenimonas koreensis TaxID=367474 RepID=UPI003783BD4C